VVRIGPGKQFAASLKVQIMKEEEKYFELLYPMRSNEKKHNPSGQSR